MASNKNTNLKGTISKIFAYIKLHSCHHHASRGCCRYTSYALKDHKIPPPIETKEDTKWIEGVGTTLERGS